MYGPAQKALMEKMWFLSPAHEANCGTGRHQESGLLPLSIHRTGLLNYMDGSFSWGNCMIMQHNATIFRREYFAMGPS